MSNASTFSPEQSWILKSGHPAWIKREVAENGSVIRYGDFYLDGVKVAAMWVNGEIANCITDCPQYALLHRIDPKRGPQPRTDQHVPDGVPCDCPPDSNQVCDICQGIDPGAEPPPDTQPTPIKSGLVFKFKDYELPPSLKAIKESMDAAVSDAILESRLRQAAEMLRAEAESVIARLNDRHCKRTTPNPFIERLNAMKK